jgi:hypothetical protein
MVYEIVYEIVYHCIMRIHDGIKKSMGHPLLFTFLPYTQIASNSAKLQAR